MAPLDAAVIPPAYCRKGVGRLGETHDARVQVQLPFLQQHYRNAREPTHPTLWN